MHRQSISNTSLETQIGIVEAALNAGDKVLITGTLCVGKTVLLKALKKKLNESSNKKAVYFTMNLSEAENEKQREDIYGQYTDKVLIIDELRTLISSGLNLDMINPDLPLVAAIQSKDPEYFNKMAYELNLDKYFNKVLYLKNLDGDLDIYTVVKERERKEQNELSNLNIIQMELESGKNFILYGDTGNGKTTLLKSLEEKLNNNNKNKAVYIDGKKIEPIEVDAILESSKGKVLIIDEIIKLLNAGVTFEQIDDNSQIIVAIQTNELDYLGKKLFELNPNLFFRKKVYLKNKEGDLEVEPFLVAENLIN